MDDATLEEAKRLVSETPGAADLNDVLRLRGTEAFSPALLEQLGPIVHTHNGKTVEGPDHDDGRMIYKKPTD